MFYSTLRSSIFKITEFNLFNVFLLPIIVLYTCIEFFNCQFRMTFRKLSLIYLLFIFYAILQMGASDVIDKFTFIWLLKEGSAKLTNIIVSKSEESSRISEKHFIATTQEKSKKVF